MRPSAVIAALLLAACSSESPPATVETCETGILGDPSQPIRMEIRTLTAQGVDAPLADGRDLALIFPPQGGRVSFVGVRATNLDGCAVQLTAALRDRSTGQLQLDGRTQNLQRDPDGWGTSGRGTTTNLEDATALGNYSNIPICPNQWASTDIFDHELELIVKVQDRNKRSATQTIVVTPRCAEPGAKKSACRCICKLGYKLGEDCGEAVDAGATP